jgi:chemosensory pili system protein ChpA (sensor histidine kinase/response regulator)
VQAPFNPLPLLSVKPGLDSSLANISRELESFFASSGGDQQALKSALDDLHRISGVLRMLSLTGLSVFCSELEKLLKELAQASAVSASQRDSIRRALFGLTHYLDALADGASNATLRLFNEYQELLQARGLEMAFEMDLFYPSLRVDLPDVLLQPPQESDAPVRIKAARVKYQRALLKWLRNEDKAEALRVMMATVRSIVPCVPQNQQRAFWWVAFGLLECMVHEGIPPELNYKKSLSRIDIKMKSLTEGNVFDEELHMSEMLYFIARSHAVSEAVDQLKNTFALDVYLPEAQPMPPSETAALLNNMRAQLNVVRDSWEHCVGDDTGACKKFAGDMETLHGMSEQLDRNTLQFLSKQIHASAAHAEKPENAQRISMDMAMALLLLDSGIEHYQHLGSGFQEQARILSSRLQADMLHTPEDENKLANLISLYCEMEQHEVMVPLANEMQGNLQHIEQNLNAFFNNAAKRAELSQVGRLLSQVQGGLHILSLDTAVQLMAMLRQVTDRYVHGGTPSVAEMRTVAAAISTLEDYVHGLVLGQKPDPTALNGVLQEISEMRSAAGHEDIPAQEEEAVHAGVSIRAGGEDEELLEVFLEEAREVMETLRNNLEVSRLHMDSREPLVTMRRGFHTLKGSGRMVGLTELGEVAWAVERAMNKWLQDNKPAMPVLLDMIGDAEVLFQHWIDMLRSGSTTATIDTTWLLTVADCIENDKEIPQPAIEQPAAEPVPVFVAQAAAVAQPVVEVEAESEQNSVDIGSVSLSLVLFDIATEEAADHVNALYSQLKVMHESETHTVSYDFMRAAHTLAGVNRTMGFTMIAELAYALELWLEERIEKPQAVNDEQLALIDQVVLRLDEMCTMVRAQRQEPQPQLELIAQLQATRVVLTQTPAPLELDSLPTLDFDLPDALTDGAAEKKNLNEITFDFAMPENAAKQSPDELQVLEVPDLEFPVADPKPATTPIQQTEPVVEFKLEVEQVPVSESESARSAVAPEASESTQRGEQRGREVHDEVDDQLLPIFLEEAHELYPQIGSAMRAWREKPQDEQLGRNLKRSLHTLKGSARMAGAMRLGELTHRVEDRVEKAVAENQFTPELWNELDNYLDRIGSSIDHLQNPHLPEAPEQRPAEQTKTKDPLEITQSIPKKTLEVGAERAMQAALLRVRSDTVDRLVNEAGEVSVARSRAELELQNVKGGVHELTESVNRLRKQLRELEIHAEGQMQARISISGDSAEKFDPLEFDRFTRFQEVTRFMNESVHDVQTVQQALLKNLAETEAALSAQGHLNRDLQQGLMAIRMVPFSSVSERLYRIVRQTGKELGKRANLELLGTEVELDRSVLEKMTAPFEHLLRNALAHGLETPEQRASANKDPIGEIRLVLRQESNEVVFDFSDDGAGLDIARVRQKAVDNGVLQENEVISDELAMQLIFTPGLSTANEVTEISGRGVGLDVVRSEITALGGRVDVSSEPGHGVRFSIHLPLTLAVTKVLMVRMGQLTYAIPSNMIENVQQIKPPVLEAAYQQKFIDWQGARYPLHYLPRLLGDEDSAIAIQPHNPILLLRAGDNRIALHVEEIIGNQEVVVKNIGPQLARLPGIAGATVSGNGAVILIINPVAFSQRIASSRKVAAKVAATVKEAVRKVPVIMVVDDSLTVRKITSRLLSRTGYQVLLAKDGVDAMEQLTEVLPDVMLLDVEMPRMDGFELAKRMRQDARTRDVPIIMITSRTADKHRQYALELGVNEYMGKPYHEEELLANIARFVTL